MPIIYKCDVLSKLKEKGFSTYRLRREKILGEKTIQLLRSKNPVSFDTLATLCELLDCQISDLIEYRKE